MPGIPVFAQFGITPQMALHYGVEYSSMLKPGAQMPEQITAKIVDDAKRLEDAGAALLDFTHSGPVAGPAVVNAVSIPVIGGLGGGPWLDGRMRMAHAAIGYAPAGLNQNLRPMPAFAVAYPEATLSMILYWPVGGPKYRINSHQRFAEHLAYVQQYNLEQVVALVRKEGKAFNADARGGPWASVIKNDEIFADCYVKQDVEKYKVTVAAMARTLFDRDTAPGAEPEDLLQVDIPALVVPGRDPSHATSAARYLEECLPKSEYWDVPVAGQTEETVPPRLLEFLEKTKS